MPAIPSLGDCVRLRGRDWRILRVEARSVTPEAAPQHLVTLLPLPSGPELQVIWEREKTSNPQHSHPAPLFSHWVPYERYRATTDAHRLQHPLPLHSTCLLSPHATDLTPRDDQLTPVARALRSPRLRLLLADDVGLGKTIQAGLLATELLARQRILNLLILAPASLLDQWQHTFHSHFAIPLQRINRSSLQAPRNPWNRSPFLITSLDFLKRDEHLHAFLASTPHNLPRDLLIIDEAHHLAPPPNSPPSDRYRLAREIIPRFQHTLLLSATPHNGHPRSFHTLLSLLDPQLFPPHLPLDHSKLPRAIIRRTRQDLSHQHDFPLRNISSIPLSLQPHEHELHQALDDYIHALLQHAPLQLLASTLKKRLLSSTYALQRSILAHSHLITQDTNPQIPLFPELLDNDIPQHLRRIAPQLQEPLQHLLHALDNALPHTDSRISKTLDLARHTFDSSPQSSPHLLVFTEFQDSLQALAKAARQQGLARHLLTLHGNTPHNQRRRILRAFSHPHTPKLLLATDTAAEGLDLHKACHNLLHFDIPWNPIRLEQRNGRIDRIGQHQPTVRCLHFHDPQQRDLHLLARAAIRIEHARHDLGPSNDVLARELHDALLDPSLNPSLELPQHLIHQARLDLRQTTLHAPRETQRITSKRQRCQQLINSSKPTLQRLLDQALLLQQRDNPNLPHTWKHELLGLEDAPLHLRHPLIHLAIHTLLNPQLNPTNSTWRFSSLRQPHLLLTLQTSWINPQGLLLQRTQLQAYARISGPELTFKPHPPRSLPLTQPSNQPPPQPLQDLLQHSPDWTRTIHTHIAQHLPKARAQALRSLRKSQKLLDRSLRSTRRQDLLTNLARSQLLDPHNSPQQQLLIPISNEQREARSLRHQRQLLLRSPPPNSAHLQLHPQRGVSITPVAALLLLPNSWRNLP